MNLQIPITSIHKVAGGISIFGTIPSNRFLKSMANEWISFRGSIGEAGRRGPVGGVPQVIDDGAMISVQAFVDDTQVCAKAQTGVLRAFKLTVDESTGRLSEVSLYDGMVEGYGTKLYKRGIMNTQVRPEFIKYMRAMGLSADGTRFLKGENQDRIDAGSGNLPEGLAPSRRASTNPSMGTRTSGRGTAKPGAGDEFDSDPMEGAQAEIDIAERFAAEFDRAYAELGEANVNGDLSPAEVARQASKIALQRMGATVVTDRSSLDDDTAD